MVDAEAASWDGCLEDPQLAGGKGLAFDRTGDLLEVTERTTRPCKDNDGMWSGASAAFLMVSI